MISIDAVAQRGSERYGDHFQILKAMAGLARQGQPTLMTSPEAQFLVKNEAFVRQESGYATSTAQDLTSEASLAVSRFFRSTPVAPPYSDDGSCGQLVAALSAQATVDAAAAVASVQKLNFGALNLSRSKGISLAAALREMQQNEEAELESLYVDRRKKVWKGEVYVRSLWRQTSVLIRAQATIAALSAHCQSRAIILHPEPDHASNGLIISLDGSGGYPGWVDVRGRHFHPNSRAIVAPYGGEDGFSL